jgi:DNA-binding LytR/AlgR family response regulator
MKPISVLIAEDEAPQRAALVALLGELWPSARITDVCDDGPSALAAHARTRPDVALLDIRLPGVDGLELARRMGTTSHVVFVTAFDQHAVEAFERGAVDYLLKPVRRERLAQTVARLEARLAAPPADLGPLLAALTRSHTQSPTLRWITASAGDTVRMVPIEEVLAFHAQDKYTRVLLARDEALIRTPLKELASSLDPELFWHVHRSLLVRATAIEHVRRDELGKLWLKLRGRPETYPVAASFHARFRGM